MSHLSIPVQQGVRFIISLVTTFCRFPFPGTDIPVILFPIGAWAIYFCWKWALSKFFDIEPKV